MKKVNVLSAIVAVVITAAVSGVVGSNAASSTTIYACVSKTSSLTKVSTKPHACPKGTLKLSWGTAGTKGATGAKGDQGAPGAQGYVGEQGPAGPAGAQGPAGSDGGGVTVYTGFNYGQSQNLIDWSAGPNGDYRIVTTANTVPEGNYFVTANTTFRRTSQTAADVYECWVSLDILGSDYTAGQFAINPGGASPSGNIAASVSGTVVVPAGGSKISLSCSGDTSTTNWQASISALKIVSLNPSN